MGTWALVLVGLGVLGKDGARASDSPDPQGQSLRWRQAGGPGWGSGLLVRPGIPPPQGLRSVRPNTSPPSRDPLLPLPSLQTTHWSHQPHFQPCS